MSDVLCSLTLPDGSTLAGTAGAHLLHDGAVVESFDAIPTRDQWYTPWGAPPDTRSLATSAEAGWLVNVHVGGVWRSPDSGRSWSEVVDVEADTHQVLARGADVVAATGAAGFGQSTDGGETWQFTSAGLHGSYCRAVAIAGDTVLVSASTGPFTHQGAVYRRGLHAFDEPFERCTDFVDGNIDTGHLTADDDVVRYDTDDGSQYESRDEGRTWAPVVVG